MTLAYIILAIVVVWGMHQLVTGIFDLFITDPKKHKPVISRATVASQYLIRDVIEKNGYTVRQKKDTYQTYVVVISYRSTVGNEIEVPLGYGAVDLINSVGADDEHVKEQDRLIRIIDYSDENILKVLLAIRTYLKRNGGDPNNCAEFLNYKSNIISKGGRMDKIK